MRVIISNTDQDEFMKDLFTVTIKGVTFEQSLRIGEKLDELMLDEARRLLS